MAASAEVPARRRPAARVAETHSSISCSSPPRGAACLISLCHPWRRSNRRPLAGRPCPASFPTTLTAPLGWLAAGDRGHPSVVAGWRDRDVRASRRRSARSQGRRRAVKRGCPSVVPGLSSEGIGKQAIGHGHSSSAPDFPSGILLAGVAAPGEREERISASVAPEHLRGSCQPGSQHCGALPVKIALHP